MRMSYVCIYVCMCVYMHCRLYESILSLGNSQAKARRGRRVSDGCNEGKQTHKTKESRPREAKQVTKANKQTEWIVGPQTSRLKAQYSTGCWAPRGAYTASCGGRRGPN